MAKDGRSIAVQFHTIPHDEPRTGAVLGKTAITDISKRRRAESVEADRNLLRTLMDHLPDAIYVKDLQHRFVAANAAVAGLMGTAPDDLLGKTDDAFYHQPLAAEFRRDEEQVLRLGQPLVDKVEPHFDAGGRGIAHGARQSWSSGSGSGPRSWNAPTPELARARSGRGRQPGQEPPSWPT